MKPSDTITRGPKEPDDREKIASLRALGQATATDLRSSTTVPGHENCPDCVNCGRGQSDR
jgi:hypothetical protein